MDYINSLFGSLWYVAVFACATSAYRCNNIHNRLLGYFFVLVTVLVDLIYGNLIVYDYHFSLIDELKFKISYFLSVAMMFVFLAIFLASLSNFLKKKGFSDRKMSKSRYLKYCLVGSCLLIIAPIETIFEYIYSSSEFFDISKSFIDFLYIWAIFDWMLVISTGYYLYCSYDIFKRGDKSCDRVGIFSVLFTVGVNGTSGHIGANKVGKR